MARRSMLVAPLVVLIAVSTAARAEPIATGTPADLVLGPLQVRSAATATTSSFVDGDLPGPEVPVLPRVPAMGMANGSAGSTTPTNRDPDIKKAGYDAWRAAEVPSMELVFASANHGSWWEPVPGRAGQRERELALFSYYTRAWFDRWLLDDTTATARLLAATVDGQPVAADLSASFRSAAFFDGTDCADLLTCGALGSTAAP